MSTLRGALALSRAEVKNAKPRGTSTLVGTISIILGRTYFANCCDLEHLEHTASQSNHDEIRLVPQPSADPADPLNFPTWQKLAVLFVMSLHPFVVNFTSSSISSALPIYAATPIFGFPPKGFSQLTYLIAVNVLMMGVSNLWWVPLANTFGRRPITLASLLLLVFSSMWAGLATSFNSLLVARLFMGIGSGPADAVSPDVVGEVFFVHQRGRAMVSRELRLRFIALLLIYWLLGHLYCLPSPWISYRWTVWRLYRCKHGAFLAALDERCALRDHFRALPRSPG